MDDTSSHRKGVPNGSNFSSRLNKGTYNPFIAPQALMLDVDEYLDDDNDSYVAGGLPIDDEGNSHYVKRARVTPSVSNKKEMLPKLSYEDIPGLIGCQDL